MRRRMRLWIGIALGILILLFLAGGALAFYRASRQPFPQTRGTLRLPGLRAPVTVIRDRWGVPHIYASNLHDLFMAQGFVHAQDRFWQMEFWRHIGTGRLSEMLGKTTLNQDRFIRTLGWNRAAQQDLERLGPEERAILEAYAAGVNAYLEHHRDRLPLEFTLFRLFGRRWEIEPWQPLHTVAWAKVMAWDLGGNWDDELLNARIVDRIGAERLKELVLPYPADRPIIVPTPVAEVPEETLRALLDIGRSLQRMTLGDAPDIGSNNWVVAGSRTVTGKPLLANDPHLSIQMPSIWYEVALHCEPVTPECPLRVAGASFPGVPGVVIGHNDRIAWGVTNIGPDVQDLYLERANPQNPFEVEFQGKWEPVRVITEEIRIAGQAEPLLLPVRITRHGPVINDVVEALTRTQTLYAFRWTALEPSGIVRALLRLNRARNWEEFHAALADWDVPGQNFVYADVDGHIGYQATGRIPIRAKGDGLLPVPGWTGEYEWTGYVPYEEMPRRLDPPEGFIVTANNAVVDPAYPYFLAAVWDYGDRAQRITDLLRAKDRLSIEDMAAIQNDTFSLAAQAITPYVLQVSFTDPLARQAQDLLRAWDFRATPESPAPTIFEAFLRHLLHEAWVDELGEEIVRELLTGGSHNRYWARWALAQPDLAWWDDLRTPQRETRDDIVRRAFEQAVAELRGRLGPDPRAWAWGKVHTATFVHGTLGQSGIGLVEAIFNRGPYPAPGTSAAVNNIGFNVQKGFAVRSLPSLRFIASIANWSDSRFIHTTGQSGLPYHPHYDDFIPLWLKGEYHPMLWSREEVERNAEGVLILQP
ncbi:penicillin acylase family protein [Thermoflexus hugenholtzii]|uniref:Penicillin amidase n=1 Tax=Thermoflexus hugenholtzii JAD2 TaxID=877466 RepID=A0A212QS11_9CHLR|nr:penicillin acylase family protein [Thermoflexus hugenholtzii]SNB62365.1 penicillin amidase [Thermoflexus hugenholtzii JAD2]